MKQYLSAILAASHYSQLSELGNSQDIAADHFQAPASESLSFSRLRPRHFDTRSLETRRKDQIRSAPCDAHALTHIEVRRIMHRRRGRLGGLGRQRGQKRHPLRPGAAPFSRVDFVY